VSVCTASCRIFEGVHVSRCLPLLTPCRMRKRVSLSQHGTARPGSALKEQSQRAGFWLPDDKGGKEIPLVIYGTTPECLPVATVERVISLQSEGAL